MINNYLSQWNIELPNECIEKLLKYESFIKKWNLKHNIVSDNDLNFIKERHICDSLTGLIALKNTKKHIDMGSGMGFPLIPLAIAKPDTEFTGIEPRSKRVLIINHIIRELELKNVKMICSQAEKTGLKPNDFDSVSCRALGSLKEDWERAQYFLNNSGTFITYKGQFELLDDKNFSTTNIPYKTKADSKEYYLIIIKQQESKWEK